MKTPLANPRRSFFEDCLESGFNTGIKAYDQKILIRSFVRRAVALQRYKLIR